MGSEMCIRDRSKWFNIMNKEKFAPTYGYHIIDGYILTPLGISDYQCTFFDLDPVYGDWTLNGKGYYLNLNANH